MAAKKTGVRLGTGGSRQREQADEPPGWVCSEPHLNARWDQPGPENAWGLNILGGVSTRGNPKAGTRGYDWSQ